MTNLEVMLRELPLYLRDIRLTVSLLIARLELLEEKVAELQKNEASFLTSGGHYNTMKIEKRDE